MRRRRSIAAPSVVRHAFAGTLLTATCWLASAGCGGDASPGAGGSGTGGTTPITSGTGGLRATGGTTGTTTGGTTGTTTGGTTGTTTGGTTGTMTGGTTGTMTGGTGGAPSAGATGGDPGNRGSGGTGTAAGGNAGQPAAGGSGGRAGTSGAGATGGAATGGGGGPGNRGAAGAGGKPDQQTLPAVTIHMAGDSTMSNYATTTTQEGWGQELGQFFISKVTIDNQAQPGANIQTFYDGRWKTLIANVKAGDYVMAAFGINDSGTTHGPVTPADFQTQMGVMADEVAAKKATFIPTTSSPLQEWSGGKETNTRLQPYCDATIALGKSKGLLVDDLNARGLEYYNMIGQTAAAALTFNGDKAHFDKQGAIEMARLASQELARIGSPLAAYLK